jgi:DNA mismatch repair protein MutL
MPVPTDTRPQIAVLPDAIINQIAAGEVVERPASVVKELVENALDAYASDIVVEIRDGGRTSMAVHDNGIGMDRASAEMALRRHATSKIRSMDDLARVASLGFRGEALPSIASVSRCRLVTRAVSDESGCQIDVVGGRIQGVSDVGRAPGTSIEVKDLFYNVPARRKFLKSAVAESRRVASFLTDLALSRPGVGFKYQSEDRVLFNTAPTAELRVRLTDLLGRAAGQGLLELDNTLDYVAVKGYVGRPDQSRSSRQKMFLYVNGRRIHDRSLMHALQAGYGSYLSHGRFPVAVVFITVPPDTVDVNVHPAKSEVRFLHPRLVYDAIYYTVNRVLTTGGAMASMAPGEPGRATATPDDDTVGHLRHAAAQILEQRKRSIRPPEATLWDALYAPVAQHVSAPAATAEGYALETDSFGSAESPATGQATMSPGRFYQFARTYIVAPTADALIVMDQHTAHERILFEAVARDLRSDLTVTQNLLFPITIELEPSAFTAYEEHHDLFDRTGFALRAFGHRTLLLEGAPAVLQGKAPDRYFREILDVFSSELSARKERLHAMAASFACKAAVKSGDVLNEGEMAALFDRLFATAEPFTCPHGRPTVVRISREELDFKFGRT